MLLQTASLPDKQEVGQPLHSLKAVTMQSILQGKGQDRIESGREDSGHLKYIPVWDLYVFYTEFRMKDFVVPYRFGSTFPFPALLHVTWCVCTPVPQMASFSICGVVLLPSLSSVMVFGIQWSQGEVSQ